MAIFESYPHCLQNLQNRFRPSLLLQQFQKFVTKYQSPCLNAHESGATSLHAKIKLRIQDYKKFDEKREITPK
jgi:hypothetical protein